MLWSYQSEKACGWCWSWLRTRWGINQFLGKSNVFSGWVLNHGFRPKTEWRKAIPFIHSTDFYCFSVFHIVSNESFGSCSKQFMIPCISQIFISIPRVPCCPHSQTTLYSPPLHVTWTKWTVSPHWIRIMCYNSSESVHINRYFLIYKEVAITFSN